MASKTDGAAPAAAVGGEEKVIDVTKISRLFVRQYYEVMNGDASKLHRFVACGLVYCLNGSYPFHSLGTHGNASYRFYHPTNSWMNHGVEGVATETVTGQQAINAKLVSLNFSNTLTEIKQVHHKVLRYHSCFPFVQYVAVALTRGARVRRLTRSWARIRPSLCKSSAG